MFERRNIQRTYLKISREVKDFLLSDKSREFFIFLFFFFVAGGFWLLQPLNNDYEADFSIPVRLKGVPNNVVITSEPASELRIKVKDKGPVLLNYMLGKSFYPVILDYADYKGVDNQVRIYPSQFEKKVLNQLNASTRLLSMKPDTLEYIYSTGASKLVPVKLRGTLIVARDSAHARIKQMLDEGKPMPEYFKKHPVYYAGPAKTPQGMASGSFGPTTAGRMDPYVDLFQSQGGSLVMVAKGNRSQQVTDACRKHGGFYLGSIGGPAAILAKNSIKSVEVVDFPELGMEAVRKIYVENFPAFIIVDDKGNDFFADFKH